jgi:hypothetical protein
VFRAATQAGISKPKTLTGEECASGAAACCKLLKEQESQSSQLRCEHLHNRYKLASELNNPMKCAKIKEIIKQEEQLDEWWRIKCAMGKPCTGATNLVQQKAGDNVIGILEAGAINEITRR